MSFALEASLYPIHLISRLERSVMTAAYRRQA